MNFTEHFTYDEMVASPTAKRKGICNAPDAKSLDNLQKLCETVLEPLRIRYGKPIIVSSGYRCPTLNKLVGGAKNSDHKFGAAADIRSVSDSIEDNMKLFKAAKQLIDEGEITVRQLIDEYNMNWIHISINHADNPTKINQILHLK